MINKIRIISAAALALAALSAHAQAPDAAAPTHWRAGVQLGTVQDHDETDPTVQVSVGYAFDRTWSVEALANLSLLFIHTGGPSANDHEFDSAVGVRALATLPLGDRWDLTGGLGVVAFQDEVGNGTIFGSTHRHKTSPMVSLSTNYRLGRRWSLGAEVSSFTGEHTFNAGLRADFHF